MSFIRINRKFPTRLLSKTKCFSSQAAQENEEYTATPEYPPILDLSYKKKIERKREERAEELKNVKTVEEKQIKMNMIRYYGIKNYMLYEDKIPYDSISLAQHVTRTHLIENEDLPEYYKSINVENIETISKSVQEALLMEIEGIKMFNDLKQNEISDVEKENILSARIVQCINRVLNNNLVGQHPHIRNNEIDVEPRLEASWVVGGMNPDESVKRDRRNRDFLKEFENDPIDRCICYIGSPTLTIRSELPLPLVIPPSEAENPALEVPHFKYDPRVLGLFIEHRHIANIPGFWPGDSHTFGLISYLKTGHMHERGKIFTEKEDIKNALHYQGILSSYAWLFTQANYLGFTTFNDITYPMVTQTVQTNGKKFKFYIYQLNTILLNDKHAMENPKRNVCWVSGSFKLYEEIKDGQLVGFNEDVLKLLIKLYSNVPAERLGVNLRPYLSDEEKVSANYQDDDKRRWLEKEYKFLMANRPRLVPVDEIYAWEKIYKIDNPSRQMEKRLRFFELFEKPWKRKLNDRLPEYIPRALRPDLPRHKGRRAKDYWP